MSKAKYMYAWKDDEGVYVNNAESIEGIIEGIIEYYDEEAQEIKIEEQDGKFIVRFVTYYEAHEHCDWDDMEFKEIEDEEEEWYQVHYELEATPWTASRFLEALARVYMRKDQFDISENN
ncbi:hypothetical protein A9Y76_07235 [Ralstonia insidiosa]|uniref:Uncharacterized protein n=1 Tax=Ralstonia insidiosa TaxID=190721 RepID=A0A191ZW13_9RALS|nr:hypothetical protein [Ralstonia insidiosa]ANJ72272.1 hypothetical protein A9Y76_07235 [Ralstonia insidiosa]